MKPVELLRPMIKEHFDFLVSEYGFVDSINKMGMENDKVCCVQYKSKKNPPMEILVGTWFPDYVVELALCWTDRGSVRTGVTRDSFDIEEINKALKGNKCKNLFRHSLYNDNKEHADKALQERAELLVVFLEETKANSEIIYRILLRNRFLESYKCMTDYDPEYRRELAEKAWKENDYEAFVLFAENTPDRLTTSDRARLQIAQSTLADRRGQSND